MALTFKEASAPKESPAHTLVPATNTLANRAADLNAATKRLTEVVEDLEVGLQKLNLGISEYVPVICTQDGGSPEWLGYTKFKNQWQIVIRTNTLDHEGEVVEHEECEFIAAQRDVRIRAIQYIPDLINKLSAAAAELTEKMNKNIEDAATLAKLVGIAGAAAQVKK